MYTGTARPGFSISLFHQLFLPCVILLADGPKGQEQNLKYIKYIIFNIQV